MEKLIPYLAQLQDVLATTGFLNRVSLPQIVTVGAQSTGKSSVLEMIIGKDFLPRGSGIVTRRPTVIQLNNTKPGSKDVYQFSHRPNESWNDEAGIRREMEKEMVKGAGPNKGISDDPLVLKVWSPDVLNLNLIDLPGITKNPVGDQPQDIEYRIKELIKRYIHNPHC
jgi:dynamin 1-like protein